MTLNIRDLARMCEFSFELQSLGTVRCLCLNTNHISQVNKKLGSSGNHSSDFVRWLFGELVRRYDENLSNEDDAIEGSSLTKEELISITDGELEGFADKLIQNNKYLLKTHKGGDIKRSAKESACDFLVHAFRHHAAEQKAQWERVTKPMSESIFASATMEAMQRNLGISDQLQDTIDKYARNLPGIGANLPEPISDVLHSSMPELHVPKNPIHETNEKLGSVVKQIEDLRPMASQAAQLIRSMNDAALRMQADYIENAKTAGRQTRIAIWIAAISLLVSAIGLAISSFFSYQSYVDAKKSEVQNNALIKAFQGEIRELATAQREERATLVKAIVDTRHETAAAVKK